MSRGVASRLVFALLCSGEEEWAGPTPRAPGAREVPDMLLVWGVGTTDNVGETSEYGVQRSSVGLHAETTENKGYQYSRCAEEPAGSPCSTSKLGQPGPAFAPPGT